MRKLYGYMTNLEVIFKVNVICLILEVIWTKGRYRPAPASKKATYQSSPAPSNQSFVCKDNHPRIFIHLGVVL